MTRAPTDQTEHDRLVAAHRALLRHLVAAHGMERPPQGSHAHADAAHLRAHRAMELAGAAPDNDGATSRGRLLVDETVHAVAHRRSRDGGAA